MTSVVEDNNILLSWAENDFQVDDGSHGIDDSWEEERSWRDPSFQKLRNVVAKWIDDSEYLVAELRKVRLHQ